MGGSEGGQAGALERARAPGGTQVGVGALLPWKGLGFTGAVALG